MYSLRHRVSITYQSDMRFMLNQSFVGMVYNCFTVSKHVHLNLSVKGGFIVLED